MIHKPHFLAQEAAPAASPKGAPRPWWEGRPFVAAMILLAAHRAIESITLDRGAAHLKDDLMPRYAELIYYGFWFSPEREMLQALIDKSQEKVEGRVRLKQIGRAHV